jgi:ABC-type glycerol-3-phosphate transport system substrate-binding protein
MKKLFFLGLVISLITLTGCQQQESKPQVNLVYYKLYESSPNFTKILDSYQKQNPHINIIYKNFTDPEVYYTTIVNEIAEGRGPDILSVHNTWVAPNHAKLTPAAPELVSPTDYESIFTNQAFQDNVLTIQDQQLVYGIPLHTDSLALYYNKSHFEETIPESGQPAKTWKELTNQSNRLTLIQNNQIQKSGLALGEGDSILRSPDIFYNLLLQAEAQLYNAKKNQSNLSKDKSTQDTLDFITSFSDSQSPNFSWNSSITSNEKELGAFLKGETSMIFGYSYLYQELLALQKTYQRQNIDTIDISDIKITTSPQINPEEPVVYSNYYTETVSRNSQNPQEAWALIGFLSAKNNLEAYYQNNFKVTSRRDMITSQKENRIYKPFLDQIGITKSFPILNQPQQKQIIKELIDTYPTSPTQSLQTADQQINQLIQGRELIPQ